MDIKKLLEVEEITISLGRELNKKAVMFKDDIANMKNLTKILENILVIQGRVAKKIKRKTGE